MERFLKFFIDNSRLTHLLFLLVFGIGVFLYIKIPKEIFPNFDLDMISITGSYTGSSIDNLDNIAVSDIEDSIKSINGISSVNTIIYPGRFSIIVELKKGTNKYKISDEIKDEVAKLKPNLPTDMDDIIVKTLDIKKHLLEIVVSSDRFSLDTLKKKANDLKSLLFNIKDIADVTIYGDSDLIYEIELDIDKIKAYDLDINSISNALVSTSFIYPIGLIEDKKHYYLSLYSNGDILYNYKLKVNNKFVYLKDIAKISKKYEDSKTLFSFNNLHSINLIIKQSNTGSAIDIKNKIEKLLKKISNKDITYTIRNDLSIKIQDRLNIVISNILLSIIIISLIVAILINVRMAFIIILGIPTSFVISMIYFYISGYTINMISLIGILIAIGIVVDDAMVVSENIQQKLEMGYNIKEASILGTKEVALPVFIASITTLFAFLPSLMISGTMGEVIKLIPIALSSLIVASLIESFIFLPLHANETLKKEARTLSWDKINKIYSKIINLFLSYPKLFLVIFLSLTIFFTIFLLKSAKFQIFPEFDSRIIEISLKTDVNTKLKDSYKIVNTIAKDIYKNKDRFFIDNITATAGYRKNSGGNVDKFDYVMSISIELKKLKEKNFVDKYITPYLTFYYDKTNRVRTKSSQEISKELQEFLKEKKYKEKFNLVDLNIVETKLGPIKADIKIGLSSNNYNDIKKSIDIITNKLKTIDGIKTISTSLTKGISEIKLKINDYGYDLGLDYRYLGTILNKLFFKKEAIFLDNGVIDLKLKSKYKDSLDKLLYTQVDIQGKKVLLKDVVDVKIIDSYEKVIKEDGKRYFYVYANVNPKIITANEVMKILDKDLKNLEKNGIFIKLKGEAEKNQELKRDLKAASIVAFVLIILSMLYLFNSFRQTFIVMSVIPLSFIGVLFGHFIMGLNLSMPSFIGALGLAGVVINDGIIMMSFLRVSKTKEEVFKASAKRFRPIILTSVTTLIGLTTLIFFPTGQAVVFQPLAVSLGFGLLWGTILNLFYLPVFFSIFFKLK